MFFRSLALLLLWVLMAATTAWALPNPARLPQGPDGTFEKGLKNPLEVPVDHVKDIKVLATVMDGKVFPIK